MTAPPASPALELCHATAQLVAAPPARCLDVIADPDTVGRWALGSWDTREIRPGLIQGHSLIDGAATVARIRRDDAAGLVDFDVGGDPDGPLAHRISVRVHDGEALGYGAGTGLVVLSAWRPAAMDDARWARLTAFHEAEILLLKAQIERAG